MKRRSRKDTIQSYKSGADVGSVGIEIVLCVLLGFFAGRWLDARFGTDPWLQMVGFLAGLGAAAKAVARVAKQMNRIAAEESRVMGDPAPLYEPEDARAEAFGAASDAGGEPPGASDSGQAATATSPIGAPHAGAVALPDGVATPPASPSVRGRS